MKLMEGNVKDKRKKHKLMLDYLKNHFNEEEEDMANEEADESGEEDIVHRTKLIDRPYMKEREEMDEEEDDDKDDRMPALPVKKAKRKFYSKLEADQMDEDGNETRMLPSFKREEDDEDEDEDNEHMKMPKHKRKELIIMMLGKKMRKAKHGKERE